jgi:hypothetical protein
MRVPDSAVPGRRQIDIHHVISEQNRAILDRQQIGPDTQMSEWIGP